MNKYELRCCCNAGLLLGILTVPKELRDKEILQYKVDGQILHLQASYIYKNPMWATPEDREGLAVKSNDYPLETLQKIPGFETINQKVPFPSSEEYRHGKK